MNQKIPTQEDVMHVFDVNGARDMQASLLRSKLVEQGFDLIESAKAMDRAISTGALVRSEKGCLRRK